MQSWERGYRSYLLRLWQVQQAGRLVWRASLEDPHTGQRLAFASLAQLQEFIQDCCPEIVAAEGEAVPVSQDEGLPAHNDITGGL